MVTGVEYTILIFAAIIGIVIFAEWSDLNTFFGAAIIILASAFTICRENSIKGDKAYKNKMANEKDGQ